MIALFGNSEQNLIDILVSLVRSFKEDDQVVIIDPKRVWQSKYGSSRVFVIQPKNRDEFIHELVNLRNLHSPRLKALIILNSLYYFRDFIGSNVKNSIINKRSYAFILSILQKQKPIPVLLTTLQNSFNPEIPIFYDLLKYYGFITLRVTNNKEDRIDISEIKNVKLSPQ